MAKKLLCILVAVLIAAAVLCCWGARTEEGWATNPDVSTWFPDWRGDTEDDTDETEDKTDGTGTKHEHTFDTTKWSSNSKNHWHAATCGHNIISGAATHTYKDGVCTVCGYKQQTAVHVHTFDITKWVSDSKNHWHAATCGHNIISDAATHTYKNGVCTVCRYKQPEEEPHVHTFDTSKWVNDNVNHWHASTCGHDIISNAEAHTYKNGVCTVCGCRLMNEMHKHNYVDGVCTDCGKSE